MSFFLVGRGGLTDHSALARGAALRRKSGAFAVSSNNRHTQKVSEQISTEVSIKKSCGVFFYLVDRDGLADHSALARGAAIRRRRLLSRLAEILSLRKKVTKRTSTSACIENRAVCFLAGQRRINGPQRFSAWCGNPPQAVAFAACSNNQLTQKVSEQISTEVSIKKSCGVFFTWWAETD